VILSWNQTSWTWVHSRPKG